MSRDMRVSPQSYRWIIVSLLFLATTNNYYNRIILSIVIPEVKRDLALTDIQYSYIVSAFQFSYMIGMLVAGKMIDWLGTRLGYLAAMFGWSIASVMHGFSGSAGLLGLWRGFLGLSEAGNFPGAIKSVSEWFPERERSFATSILNSGPNVALITGAPVIAFLTLKFGWRGAVIIIGSTGILLMAAWLIFYRKDTPYAGTASPVQQKIPWHRLFKHPETYGIMIGKFLTDPVWWFYLFWLPNYLNAERGYDIKQIAVAVPLIYIIAALMGILGGWLPGWFMKQGWTLLKARKTTMLIFASMLPFTIYAVYAENVWISILFVGLACGAHTGWSNNILTLSGDQFPSQAVGSVTGLGGFAGGLGGLLLTSALVGYIVTYVGYFPIFILMGIMHPAAMLCIHLLIRKNRQIESV